MYWKNDQYWTEALEAALRLSEKHKLIVVPEEFFGERDAFFPETHAKRLRAEEITAFAIPKDRVSNLPAKLVEDASFLRFHCVFANGVFVVYSTLDEDAPAPQEQIEQHTPYFHEKRARYLKSWVEEAGSPGEGDSGSLPYLLDTQKNRILKKMLPNERYVMELFRDLSREPGIIKRSVFEYCVKQVTLELSGYCNRRCSYCPVKDDERRKDKARRISPELAERCIEDLSTIGFSGKLCFQLFNEPTYDRDFLLEMIGIARKRLPGSYIWFATNGDYLSKDYFWTLAKSGLSELGISVHYAGTWNHDEQVQRIYEMLERIGIGDRGSLEDQNRRLIYHVDESVYSETPLVRLMLRSEDFALHGFDRGGVLNEGILRVENMDHCTNPIEQFTVAFDGTLVPCCAIWYDTPEDKSARTFGNLSEFNDIFDAYSSAKAAAFRRAMFAPRANRAETPSPCAFCSIGEMNGAEQLYRLDDGVRREIFDCWLKTERE